MTNMFLTISKDGQAITLSDTEVTELIDQLDDMMGELATVERREEERGFLEPITLKPEPILIPKEIPVDMPSVESKPEPKKSSPAELCSFFLGL